MPRPSTRAEPGACSARWTGPSGGKSDEASSGVISDTSPGDRREHQVRERGEPGVLVGPQAEREDAAGRVARRGDVGAVAGEALQQRRVVRAGLAQEGPQPRIVLRAGGGRQDPRARVGGPARVRGIDHSDARPEARQLVGQREADQAGADHGDVVALPVHATESTRLRAGMPAVGHDERRGLRAHTRPVLRRPAGLPLLAPLRPAARRLAHALHRRGTRGSRDRPLVARAANLVLPLPHCRGPARRPRPARGGAGPDRVRALRQARGADGAHGPGSRRLDTAVRRGRRARRRDPRGAGLGRAHRSGCAGRPARTGSARGRRQHGVAHGRRRAGGAPGLGLPRRRRTGP